MYLNNTGEMVLPKVSFAHINAHIRSNFVIQFLLKEIVTYEQEELGIEPQTTLATLSPTNRHHL